MSRTANRQKTQLELAFLQEDRGNAPPLLYEGTEVDAAASAPESPAVLSGPTMEKVVARDNLTNALARVRRNKGAPGVDDMTVDNLAPYLKDH